MQLYVQKALTYIISIPKLGFIWKKIGKKLISTDYGRYGSQYSPKKSKEG